MIRRIAQVLFWVWAPMPIVLVGFLAAQHMATLPAPHQVKVGGSGWRVLHVLALKCACSRQVIAHLIARGATPGTTETLLLVGDDAVLAAQVKAAGFQFEQVTSTELGARYGVQGAPLLAVVDPDGRTVYSGGYSQRWRGAPEDVAILAAARAARPFAALPLFGCAISRALQAQLDPLGLKYSQD